jgi:GNAT superfamily N-acetyltransferase
MASAVVRPALPDETLLLATLQRAWWREAYPDLLPDELLQVSPERLAEAWRDQLSAGSALIAEENTHPVGFALVASALDEQGRGRIEVLGVLPRWGRRGHGGRLIAHCADGLRALGAEQGSWWAVESDPSVASFLAGIGWSATGRRRVLDTGERTFAEIEYAGTLDLVLL